MRRNLNFFNFELIIIFNLEKNSICKISAYNTYVSAENYDIVINKKIAELKSMSC